MKTTSTAYVISDYIQSIFIVWYDTDFPEAKKQKRVAMTGVPSTVKTNIKNRSRACNDSTSMFDPGSLMDDINLKTRDPRR